MNHKPSNSGEKCEAMQELIVWYPTRTLNEGERLLVESHVAGCPECAEFLQFAFSLRERCLAAYSSHPIPELLVSYAEDKTALEPPTRSILEEHIAACADCRKEIDILIGLDEQSSEDVLPALLPSKSREKAVAPRKDKQNLWDTLRAGLFGPVPAAAYLVIAVFAIGFHLIRPMGPTTGQDRDARLRAGKDLPSGAPAGVVLLADESGRVRRLGGENLDLPKVDASKPQYLLLELINLEAPPDINELYRIELTSNDTKETVVSASVRGETFLENYTICLPLAADVLLPGVYAVTVTGPDGETLYRSTMQAE